MIFRSVRDTAAMLDILTAIPDRGGPYLSALPAEPYAQLVGRDPGRLRIGYLTNSPIGTSVGDEAVEHAVALLTGLDHEVEPVELDIDGHQLAQDFSLMWSVEVATTIADIQRTTGPVPETSNSTAACSQPQEGW